MDYHHLERPRALFFTLALSLSPLLGLPACWGPDPAEDTSASGSGAASSSTSLDGESSSAGAPAPDLPDGATCHASDRCISGHGSWNVLLSGVCGPSEADADCDGGGCTPGNTYEGSPPACNAGALGDGCESDAVCKPGLRCATVLDILDGAFTIRTCGTCLVDDDCAPGFLGGARTCILPGALPLHASCDLEGNGDAACASGRCSPVPLQSGVGSVGACSECESDAHCGGGTCQPGELDSVVPELLGNTCS